GQKACLRQGEEAFGVGGGGGGDGGGGCVAQGGDAFQDGRDARRFIALAAVPCIGLVGGVGFQQQVFDRHGRGELAQASRAFVGDRAAEAEQEAQFPQLFGLFAAARETVDHAAHAADLAD